VQPVQLPTSHLASSTPATELHVQLQSIYETLHTSDFKQLLMVYITSPELVGMDLLNVFKEDFQFPRDQFSDFACIRTTFKYSPRTAEKSKSAFLLPSRCQNCNCSYKALYCKQASVSIDDDALVLSHAPSDHVTRFSTADSHSAVQ
jgi:hypothetical protein